MCDFRNKITGKKPFTIVFTHKNQHGFQDIGISWFFRVWTYVQALLPGDLVLDVY